MNKRITIISILLLFMVYACDTAKENKDNKKKTTSTQNRSTSSNTSSKSQQTNTRVTTSGAKKNRARSKSKIGAITLSGKVQLPSKSDYKDLTVISGFHQGTLTSDGTFSVKNNSYVAQLVMILKDTDIKVMGIGIASDADYSMDLTAETTAEALFFLSPLFATTNPDEANKKREIIRSHKEFKELVALIDKQQKDGTFSATDVMIGNKKRSIEDDILRSLTKR